MLRFLRDNIKDSDNLVYCVQNFKSPCEGKFDLSNVTERFAVYKIRINEDFSANEVISLKVFDNEALSNDIYNCIKNNMLFDKISKSKNESSDNKEVLLLYYFYPVSKSNPDKAFISFFDV